MNVALTRAKRHLIVLGNSQPLRQASPAMDLLLRTCQGQESGQHAAYFYGTSILLQMQDNADHRIEPTAASDADGPASTKAASAATSVKEIPGARTAAGSNVGHDPSAGSARGPLMREGQPTTATGASAVGTATPAAHLAPAFKVAAAPQNAGSTIPSDSEDVNIQHRCGPCVPPAPDQQPPPAGFASPNAIGAPVPGKQDLGCAAAATPMCSTVNGVKSMVDVQGRGGVAGHSLTLGADEEDELPAFDLF